MATKASAVEQVILQLCGESAQVRSARIVSPLTCHAPCMTLVFLCSG